jgi:energy-coupling factor transporter ATP-binding protein EcfA2
MLTVLNDPRPWWGMLRGRSLSLAELLANETIPPRGAAVLWWALERGASLFVAAGPSGAGKSTLATALLPFLPPDARLYVTSGPRDGLRIPPGPGPIYLLINELSWHTPWYLYGDAARRAFLLLRDGTRVIGALHARSAREAVEVMLEETGAPAADVARVQFVAVLGVGWTRGGLLRRVVEISRLLPPPDGSEAVEARAVAVWDEAQQRLELAPGGLEALADWAGEPAAGVAAAVEARAAELADWPARGVRTHEAAAEAVRHFGMGGEPLVTGGGDV